MKYIEHAKEGLQNLYFSKLRSILALLGVLVGTASVVAMVLGGQLATHEALKQFKSLGTNLLAVSISDVSSDGDASIGRTDKLSALQALEMSKGNSGIERVAPYTQLFHQTYYNGVPLNGGVLGVTESFADIVHVQLKQGRFISLADKYEAFCVVGHDIYEMMKTISSNNPIGQQIQIGKNVFVVVGVADSWSENSFVYANIDNSIMIPLMASTLLSKYTAINNIILRLSPTSNISTVEMYVTQYISALLSNKQINYRSAKELIAKMQKQNDILTVFLAMIGSISLLVGGIGVMNIMLVSVVERRREIGIRLAVGATRADISALFLMEAIMLSLVGGIAGVVIGILIAYVIALFQHWEFTLFIWPPIAGFSVSVLVGIFFGFYPAYLASKLDPIEALRSD
ncbi:MAG: ABC transporter permease [Gammaproteobacteria bacterium]